MYYTNLQAAWSNWTNAAATTTSYGWHDPWAAWCTNATSSTSATITCTQVWSIWSAGAHINARVLDTRRAPPPETSEQRAAREARDREYRARADAERAARALAERKAEALLLRHLTAAQREEYLRDGAFTVRMEDGRRYRIRKGWSGNVDHFEAPQIEQVLEREGGIVVPAANGAPRRIEQLCIHPREIVPHCDNMLAQKLLLESDEAEFRRIANITRVASR